MAGSRKVRKEPGGEKAVDAKPAQPKRSYKIPRRKLTLIGVTTLLNVLLWSSIICITATIFQIVLDPIDTTNIVVVVLTLVSALTSIFYIVFHTIFSFQLRVWMYQPHKTSAIKNTTYIATRFAVSLCVLWLLTCGWNIIIVARRPFCSAATPELERWEYGLTCHVSRAGIAFALLALITSFVLFVSLNLVRRPFEAHVYSSGYQKMLEIASEALENKAQCSEELDSEKHRRSMSTYISNASDMSFLNLDFEGTKDDTSPRRSMSVFTSNMVPPPIPLAFQDSRRASFVDTTSLSLYPSASQGQLTRPPRLSGLVGSSGFVPLSVPVQYSASAWKAVHPPKPSLLGSSIQSQPQLRELYSTSRNRYSRSSVSLTRPQRLSTASRWSSRSGSLDLERTESGMTRTASSDEIARAILNGTTIPGTETSLSIPSSHHTRTYSAPDATVAGAQQPHTRTRMAKGWKPQLSSSASEASSKSQESTSPETTQPTQSRSMGFLSNFSPDVSPDDDSKMPAYILEQDIRAHSQVKRKPLPIRRSWSGSQVTDPAKAKAVMLSKMPNDICINTRAEEHDKKKSYDEIKNKPLPQIAVL